MSMARKVAGAAAFLFISMNASAEPPPAPPRPTDDTAATVLRLDDQARRSETAARDGRTRASALMAVARLARAKSDTMTGGARLEAEEGLAYLHAHIQSVESLSRGDERAALEYRTSADRLRGRTGVASGTAAAANTAVKADVAAAEGCDPPFSFDSAGHKRWRPECF